MKKNDKFTPRQIEVLSTLLAFSNFGLPVKINGDSVSLDNRTDLFLTSVTPRKVAFVLPTEIDEQGFVDEAKMFAKDLKKNGITKCASYWGDLVNPVVQYVTE